jgi:hypothetical protein
VNRKEFKINATLDTQEFDKSVESMQKKLRELYAPSDMLRMQSQTGQRAQGMGFPGMSQPTSQDFQRATNQAKREMDASIRAQIEGQDKLLKLISAREKALKDLKKQQDGMTKGSEDELKTKEKIARVEENLARQRHTYRKQDEALNQAMDAKQRSQMSVERLRTAYEHGGIGGAARAGGRMMGGMGMGAMAISGLSALGTGLGVFSNFYRDYGRAGMDTNLSLANAAQGSIGRDVSNIYGRRTAFEMPFMGERARAAKQALEVMRTNKNSDNMSILGNIATGAAGGATAGTFVGGPVGTVIGGAIGAVGGLGYALTDQNKRDTIMSNIPIIGKKYEERLKARRAEELVKNYTEGYEAEKNLNPFKKAAVGEYEQNMQRNLDAQRMMGMSNDDFYGSKNSPGFMGRATDAGFTPEIALQMSQGIIGAGGSTRMAGDSIFGAELSRGLNLTNSANVLGTLSGSMGSAETTKNATIKILAEGMRLGLDDSKFAEENRKFTQAAADVIARTGATSEEDAGRIAGKFGSFVADKTTAGISAAKSAYEEYQQMSSSTSGSRGVMRASGFMSDPKLAGMSTMDKQALMQIPEDQVSESSTFVQGLAKKYKMDPKDIISAVEGVNKNSQNRYKEADVIRDRVQGYLKKEGITLNKETFGELPDNIKSDIASYQSYQMNEYGFKDTQTSQSRAFSSLNGNPITEADIQADREETLKKKAKGSTGRVEDATISAMAGDSATVLKNFNDLRPSLKDAAEQAAKFTHAIREMNAELMTALEAARRGDKGAADALTKIMERNASMAQPQGGRTSK